MPNTTPAEFDYEAILHASPVAMLLVDVRFRIVFANRKAEELFGYAAGTLQGLGVNELVPPEFRVRHASYMDTFYRHEESRPMSKGRFLPLLKSDGERILVEIGLTPATCGATRYILVSALEVANQVVNTASHRDALTGLPGRNLFREMASNLLKLAIRERVALALLFIDLDEFKTVNDRLGHAVGDRLLCRVSEILMRGRRGNDIVARFGGDEFLICLYDVGSRDDAENIARDIVSVIGLLHEPWLAGLPTGASIGLVHAENPSQLTLEQLIDDADRLMYEAKQAGRGRVVVAEAGA